MKYLPIFIILLQCTGSLQAQCFGDYSIDEQTEMDYFTGLGCTTLIGNLSISGANGSPEEIDNLHGLLGLKVIQGNLFMSNITYLSDLTGLDSLTSVEGLFIDDSGIASLHGLEQLSDAFAVSITNTGLYDLTGLSSLDTVQYLTISYNDYLTSMDGLSALEVVSEQLRIFNNSQLVEFGTGLSSLKRTPYFEIKLNPVLTSLYGLSELEYVYFFEIIANYQLQGLQGLDSLGYVASFYIHGIPLLEDFNGINNLDSLGEITVSFCHNFISLSGIDHLSEMGGLSILNCDKIKELDELTNLKSIGGITLENNDSLLNLHGLENVANMASFSVSGNNTLTTLQGLDNDSLYIATSIVIYYNDTLSYCHVPAICNAFINTPWFGFTISGNYTGCNTAPEVEAQCFVSTDSPSDDLLSVYVTPNPSSDNIKVHSNSVIEALEICSTDGTIMKRMFHSIRSGEQVYDITVDISGFKPGFYLINIITDNRSYLHKLLKI